MQRRLARLLAPAGDEQPDAERPLPGPLRRDLRAVRQRADQPARGEPALVDEAVRGALRAHRAQQAAAVADEARDGDAEVVVDLEDLGLVRGELGGRALEGGEDAVGRRLEAGLFVFLRLCFRGGRQERGGNRESAVGVVGVRRREEEGGGRRRKTTRDRFHAGKRKSEGGGISLFLFKRTLSPTAALPCFTASMAYSTCLDGTSR